MMKVERRTLEQAHATLTSRVRHETVKSLRTGRAPEPPSYLMYRRTYNDAPIHEPTMRALGKLAKGLANQMHAHGYTLHRGGMRGRESGFTNAETMEVHIATGLQPEYEVAVMIHELAHIMLRHAYRGQMRYITRDLAEVEAESVAYLVAQTLGLDPLTCSAAYIANWATGDMELLRMSAARCITVAEAILEDL